MHDLSSFKRAGLLWQSIITQANCELVLLYFGHVLNLQSAWSATNGGRISFIVTFFVPKCAIGKYASSDVSKNSLINCKKKMKLGFKQYQ